MSIVDLGQILIVRILINLDHKTILTCCLVCKVFNTVIRNSKKLQYTIELAFDGMIDIPGGGKGMSADDKLQLLLDRRNAWKTLEWKRKVQVPMSSACKAYEFVSGVFANINKMDSSAPQRLAITRLPSTQDEGACIVREDVGVKIKDFVIDPTQDLAAYVSEHGHFPHGKIKIHLRTMSSGIPHPSARKPVISHSCTLPFHMVSSTVAVADDVIAIFFCVDSSGLIIWNWKTSDMLVYFAGHLHLPAGAWDFSLISNRAFLLTCRARNGSIEIYSFESPSTKLKLNHIASLELPALQDEVQLALFSTHSGPFTTVPNKEYQQASMAEDKPFVNAPDSRVHAIRVQYHMSTAGGLEKRLRFFFYTKNSCFLKFVEDEDERRRNEAGPSGKRPVRKFRWEEWGPDNTRFMSSSMKFRWLRYVHGQKVVCSPCYAGQESSRVSTLKVLDFNIHVKRLPEEISVGAVSGNKAEAVFDRFELFSRPSVVIKPEIFLNPITSRLPYSRALIHMEETYSGFMIDEERIVGLKPKSSSGGETVHVDVFTF